MEITTYKEFPKLPGIYCFTNLINNKKYVGQAFSLRKRIRQHIGKVKCGKLEDKALYLAINKYGFENFKVETLVVIEEELDKEKLLDKLSTLEICYIEKYNSFGESGYNRTKGGESKLGVTHDNYTRLKISQSNKIYAKEHYREVLNNLSEDCQPIVTYAVNIATNKFYKASSRSGLSKALFIKFGLIIEPTQIRKVVRHEIHSTHGFVFGNSYEECKSNLEYTKSGKTMKHSPLYAPNYQKYLEWLITVCDCNGFIPTLVEIGKHFDRKPSTIAGWNKKIAQSLRLNKKYNRLELIGYSNSHIDYKPKISPIWKEGNPIY